MTITAQPAPSRPVLPLPLLHWYEPVARNATPVAESTEPAILNRPAAPRRTPDPVALATRRALYPTMTALPKADLGTMVKRARRRKGMPQTVLAQLIGRSESWISQLERGARPCHNVAVLRHLARALNVDIDVLIKAAS